MKKNIIDVSTLAFEFNRLTDDHNNSENFYDDSADNVEAQLKEIIVDLSEVPHDKFSWDGVLKEDFGLDSLDMVELVMICEKDFYISVPDREWQKLRTASDLLDLVTARVG